MKPRNTALMIHVLTAVTKDTFGSVLTLPEALWAKQDTFGLLTGTANLFPTQTLVRQFLTTNQEMKIQTPAGMFKSYS